MILGKVECYTIRQEPKGIVILFRPPIYVVVVFGLATGALLLIPWHPSGPQNWLAYWFVWGIWAVYILLMASPLFRPHFSSGQHLRVQLWRTTSIWRMNPYHNVVSILSDSHRAHVFGFRKSASIDQFLSILKTVLTLEIDDRRKHERPI